MRIAFIGLGEAASAFISGWGATAAGRIAAFDIKTDHAETRPEIEARAAALGIELALSPAAALAGADLVFSAVTADQAVAAAEAGAPHLAPGAVWCDLNSCAPASKVRASEVITSSGGRYLDVAVMAPVHPGLNLVPALVSGPAAAAMAPVLEGLPMNIRVAGDTVGRASSIKMVRSIMVKGIEALTAECALAAERAGVSDEVFASLKASHGGIDWAAKAVYNLERMLRHGARRAAEMEEVVRMLDDLGLPSDETRGTVAWQRRLAESGLDPHDEDAPLGPAVAPLLKRFGR